MMRRYILFGLFAAIFLPTGINAAAFKPEKPTLLIVYHTDIPKHMDLVRLPSQTFYDFVTKLVGSAFVVKTKILPLVKLNDLTEASQVLIVDDYDEDFSETRIMNSLKKKGLDKVFNKAFVWIGSEEYSPKRITVDFRNFFQYGIFKVHWKVGREGFEEDVKLEFLKQFLQDLIQKQVPLAPSLSVGSQKDVLLQQMIENFAADLNRLTQETQRLNQETQQLNQTFAQIIARLKQQ